MSEEIPLTKHIHNRWRYHFCEENMPDCKDVKVCIGYAYSRYLLDDDCAAEANHRLLSMLAESSRKIFLIDYDLMCKQLLTVSLDCRVYAYSLHALEHDGNSLLISNYTWVRQVSANVVNCLRVAAARRARAGSVNTTVLKLQQIVSFMRVRVGLKWMQDIFDPNEDPKNVWTRQNGMCAYCDTLVFPPDGESMGTFNTDYIEKVNQKTDREKVRRMKIQTNTALGKIQVNR